MRFLVFAVLLLTGTACNAADQTIEQNLPTLTVKEDKIGGTKTLEEMGLDQKYADYQKAYFAGGCFWCTEAIFERVNGVVDVWSGYTGGTTRRVTYEQSNTGRTGHAEAIVVYFDPEVVSYAQLVEFFFAAHDPTQVNRQGPDRGPQYRSGIYFMGDEQGTIAKEYKEMLDASGKFDRPIATEIAAAGEFWVAEDYHQDYYRLHPTQGYVYNVSRPKVEKFVKAYKEFLKPEYQE